jgi:outer membrane protein assembly factor BamB
LDSPPQCRVRSIACVLLLLAAARSDAQPPGTWSTYHGDAALTGASSTPVPSKPVRLWRTRIGASALTTPVSDGRLIFCANDRGEVRALDTAGKPAWTSPMRPADAPPTNANETVSSPLTTVCGLVAAASPSGRVYAFDASNGVLRWVYDAQAPVQGSIGYSPVPSPDAVRLFVATQPQGAIHAVLAATGRAAWVAPGSARFDGSPAVAGATIVHGSCAAGLHVRSAANGDQTAFIALGEGHEMAGGVALAGSRAFVGDRSGTLVCADLERGSVVWTNACGEGELFTTPAVAGGRVVCCAGNGEILCFSADTGRKLWQYTTGSTPPLSPVIAADSVVAASGGTLYLLSLTDGALLWSARDADEVRSPAVVNGMILSATDDGYVNAYGK